MTKESKQKPKPDDKEQSKRFIETARELEADESGKEFERVIKKVFPSTPPPKRRQQSDPN